MGQLMLDTKAAVLMPLARLPLPEQANKRAITIIKGEHMTSRHSMTLLAALLGTLGATGSASAETVEERLARTEARLAAIENRQQSTSDWQDRLTVHGFATLASRSTNTLRNAAGEKIRFEDTGTDLDLTSLTRAGLRIETEINDRTDFVVQLLAEGEDDFDAQMQWAYISYDINPALTFRAGRLVLPVFMHSQYTQASYAYPWVELPSQVYGILPVDTMEGLDFSLRFNTGPLSHLANLTYGSTDVAGFEVDDQAGINLTSYLGNWTTRLSYAVGQTSIALPDLSPMGPNLAQLSFDEEFGYFASAGLQYDNGRLLVMSEWVQLSQNAPKNSFPTQSATYIFTGYRFGPYMPHVTWTSSYSDDDNRCATLASPVDQAGCVGTVAGSISQSKSWTFGLRYELAPGVSLKAEAQRFYDFSNDGDTNGVLFVGANGTSNVPADDEAAVFRFAIDAAF